MNIRLALILLVLFLASCAHIPSAIDGEKFQLDITPQQVTNNPESHIGKPVRWGGVIVEVVNNEQQTWIEILALPLSANARPQSDRTDAMGRFIAKTDAFLDPEVYQKGLRLTVTGTLSQPIDGKVGERSYMYPTVNVENHYLWPRRTYHRHYVNPGYWFYGFHPYWRFGYPYFGYGVWSYRDHYYPYFPVYGYLSRSTTRPHHHYQSGNFAYARSMDWSLRHRAWLLRNSHSERFIGHANPVYRHNNYDNTKPVSVNRNTRSTRSNSVTQKPQRVTRSSSRSTRSSVPTRPSRGEVRNRPIIRPTVPPDRD